MPLVIPDFTLDRGQNFVSADNTKSTLSKLSSYCYDPTGCLTADGVADLGSFRRSSVSMQINSFDPQTCRIIPVFGVSIRINALTGDGNADAIVTADLATAFGFITGRYGDDMTAVCAA